MSTHYSIHAADDLPMGGFRAVTGASEALPPCWAGPLREWPLEAARDHGEDAPEALRNFLREQAAEEGRLATRYMVAGGGEDLSALAEEFPGFEFEVWEFETWAELPAHVNP